MAKQTIQDLQMLQALPLEVKIQKTKNRIREWIEKFGEDGVYVSFSGGKDSTVLLDLVRQDYPNVKAMFVDVPTQYPELREFAQSFENVDIIKPKISFMQVCEKYGFPLISKEVSNNVDGARKYIKILTDRQTDRQTDKECVRQIPYSYNYRRIKGIGEYNKRRLGESKRKSSKTWHSAWNENERQSLSSKGDYP